MIGIEKSIKGKDVVVITANSCLGLIKEYYKYIRVNSCYSNLIFCESPVCRFIADKGRYALAFTWYDSLDDWRNDRLPKYNLSTIGMTRRTLRGVEVVEFNHDLIGSGKFGILLDGMSEDDLYDVFSKTLKQSSDFIADLSDDYVNQHCSWYMCRLPIKGKVAQGFCIYPETLAQSGVFEDYIQVLGKSLRLI